MSGPGLAYADRVQETSATGGTGTLTLGGAVAGYRAFSVAFATGQSVNYAISDGVNWEVGKGTYTLAGTLLSRDLVFSSSNSNALVSFPGTVNVWCDVPANTFADRGMTLAMASCVVPQ